MEGEGRGKREEGSKGGGHGDGEGRQRTRKAASRSPRGRSTKTVYSPYTYRGQPFEVAMPDQHFLSKAMSKVGMLAYPWLEARADDAVGAMV